MGIDYLSVITDQSNQLAQILRTGPLDAPIAGCPGWNLGNLGVHMVDVQRWSTNVIRTGQPGGTDEPSPSAQQAAEALEQSSQAVVQALREADPSAPCWNFGDGPQVAQFWFSRQAFEIAVHRWDASAAVSDDPDPIERELAAHVIDEFVHIMLPRAIVRDNIDVSAITADVHVHCTDLDGTDAPGEWTFEIIDNALVVTDEHRKAAVALRGPSSDLALLLYGRIGPDAIEMFGEPEALAQWSELAG